MDDGGNEGGHRVDLRHRRLVVLRKCYSFSGAKGGINRLRIIKLGHNSFTCGSKSFCNRRLGTEIPTDAITRIRAEIPRNPPTY